MADEILTYDRNAEIKRKEKYMHKTAGDMVQCKWHFEHSLDYRFYSAYNACQSSFMHWGRLGYCLLGSEVDWNEHSVADLCETITLYLPPELLHLYLQCLANFHMHYFSHMILPSCEFVGTHAPCFRRTIDGSNFCRCHTES